MGLLRAFAEEEMIILVINILINSIHDWNKSNN